MGIKITNPWREARRLRQQLTEEREITETRDARLAESLIEAREEAEKQRQKLNYIRDALYSLRNKKVDIIANLRQFELHFKPDAENGKTLSLRDGIIRLLCENRFDRKYSDYGTVIISTDEANPVNWLELVEKVEDEYGSLLNEAVKQDKLRKLYLDSTVPELATDKKK